MPVKTSGTLSLTTDIVGEFGGSAPHAMSEYYGVANGIPGSGTISMSNFYGASSITEETWVQNGGPNGWYIAPTTIKGVTSPQQFTHGEVTGVPAYNTRNALLSNKLTGSVGPKIVTISSLNPYTFTDHKVGFTGAGGLYGHFTIGNYNKEFPTLQETGYAAIPWTWASSFVSLTVKWGYNSSVNLGSLTLTPSQMSLTAQASNSSAPYDNQYNWSYTGSSSAIASFVNNASHAGPPTNTSYNVYSQLIWTYIS